MTFSCSRRSEVRRALEQGHWPQACAPDLRAHVDACTQCANDILITTRLATLRANTLPAADPAPASILWWRAQTRRRNAAIARAGRPLAAAQIFALLILAFTLAGILAAHWHTLVAAGDSATPAFSLSTLLGDWGLAPILLAAILLTTLSGVVLYLTADRP